MIPIGRPIDNTRVYVLDEQQQPVPIGVPGELYLGGVQVARGYLNRPALTAERFIPDPFVPGGRLYRTGDLARWLPDGAIEDRGRIDHQVKIRGARIELGEIEAVLGEHPAVKSAVVVAREDRPGQTRLVAYWVPVEGAPAGEADLAKHLGQRLPEVMVPSAFVRLAAIPLLGSGKIDRGALPAPSESALDEGEAPARGPIEEAVSGFFAELLGVTEVGAHQSFFALGGHSLLGTRLMARIRKAFGIDLPLRALFEASSPAELSARVEAALREGRSITAPPLEPVPRTGPLPLSFAQERLWFLAELDPEDRSYVIPALLRLTGSLDRDAMERALAALAARHELLRTTVTVEGGAPVQIIHPAGRIPLVEVDLGGLPAAARSAELRRQAAEEARRSFDLSTGPLLRARLFLLSVDEQVLLLTMHHIVADAWSLGLLEREILLLYRAFRAGEAPSLPALPVQYADYAVWQRRFLSGDALRAELEAWRERLSGSSFVLDLPADRPRPRVRSSRGGLLHFTVPADLTAALDALGQREGATLFMTLLAAFVTLLHRYTGQSDLVVGTPIAGRTRAETEGLIGFFVNTLVLRAEPLAELPFSALLGQVRETCLWAYAHQDLPFERLVQELSPARDLGRTPLFQVMFALQNARAIEGVARSAGSDEAIEHTSKFDLLLIMGRSEQGLIGSFEFATDLFEPGTVARMAEQLRVLLGGIAASPASKLGALPLLPPAEELLLRATWNRTERVYPREAGIAQLFEAQVERSPGAPALSFEGDVIDYRSLNERANRLAHRLVSLGLERGARVGICAPRDPSLVVGLLAILKAGCAYVPLDPAYPSERLGFMIADAELSVIFAAEETKGALPLTDARILPLEGSAADPAEDPPARAGGGDSAYVIYTSGSTGVPKGVEVLQRGVSRLVLGTDYIALRPDDRVAQASNTSFDAATFEIWGALLNGACLVFVPREVTLSSERFIALLRAEAVTTLFLTTALFNSMVREDRAAFRTLRTVLFGGEAVDPRAVREALIDGPERLLHVYGPTETTTFATWHEVREVAGDAVTVPIGQPIANTRAHVLDPSGALVPIGVPGELYLGGDGVARGYLGRPALTEERFVPDPFGAAGERLYRTGDLVRRLADGALVFLGRLDQQVKIRGFRVELGEIEAVLSGHPGVEEAAVLLREDRPGDRRLVAYVASGEGAAPRSAELRSHLERKLPEHMIPSAFVVLAALPLTPNGKVDRRALPAPEVGADEAPEAPRDPVEEAMVSLFADVLKQSPEQIGVRSSFFALGGHSLLAASAIARIRATFGVDLPLRALFEAPTPAALAALVEQALREGQALSLPPIQPVPREGPLPLSFAQERLWFLDQLTPGDPSYVVPIAQRLTGSLHRAALEQALSALAARHEALRTTFALQDGRPVQLIHPPAPMALSVVEIGPISAPGAEDRLRALVGEAIAAPFDLAHGPVIRAHLFTLGEDDALLLMALHHIAADGWSVGILSRELSVLYSAFVAGEEPALPAISIQPADHAVWQRAYLAGDALSPQLGYWRARLAGAPFTLDLPSDRPRPPVRSSLGGKTRFTIPAEFSRALGDLARAEGVTLFMTLFGAFATLLSRLTGQRDLLVGSPIANRPLPELGPLVGFLVNTLVLRAEIDAARPFRDLLAQVKETCLSAYAHQDLPFERLVEELSPERDPSRTPLFQVMFVLQHAPRGGAEMTGVQRRGAFAESATAKFDLTLTLVDGPTALAGLFEYSRDLFEPATIERFIACFQVLLQGIVDGPGQRIGALPVVPPRDREKLLGAFNATAVSLPEPHLAHALIEASVLANPGAVALRRGDGVVSFSELSRRSNQLAHRLRALGVGPDAIVGICARRTPALVIGMLGIWKAGGAYLPLDPELPRDRLSLLVEDSAVEILLCEDAMIDRLPKSPAKIVSLDDEAALASEPVTCPESGVSGDHLAYVIYTSGSTGRPKGVMIEHRGVVNYLRWCVDAYRIADGSGSPVHSSIGFDLTVTSLWAPLAAGRTVTLVPEERGVLGLADALREGDDFSLIKLTPSHLEALSAELSPAEIAGKARALVIGGEALLSRHLDFVRAHAPGTRLFNEYGPTETVVGCVVHEITEGALPAGPIPIGRPIANTRIYILDDRQALLPIGVTGEICIAGAQVGRGYLHRPDLGAERFLPDPFVPGERMYRSGDLGRYLASGEIVYLGRRDQQVKVRGVRVELGEIEAVMAGHPAVREAAVLLRDDRAGAPRLVGYCTGEAGTALDPDEVRRFLATRLPEAMVPAEVMVLGAMPLTDNGKIDRARLPAPVEREAEAAGGDGPRGPIEEAIVAIFADVLHRTSAPVSASFFDLGGHSLLAVRALGRIRTIFGVDLPLRALFEASSAEALARRVEAALATERGALPKPIRASGDEGPAPLSFGQERLWVLAEIEPDDRSYMVPIALRFSGALDHGALDRALVALTARHALLRTTYETSFGQPVQVVHPPLATLLSVTSIDAATEEEREEIARRESLAEARRGFDLRREPPFRARLLVLGETERVLLLTMHHIVSDAWSQGILLRELGELYRALSAGVEPRLRALPIQYADYARWQRGDEARAAMEADLAYWKGALSGAPSTLDLPADHARPPVQSHRGAQRVFSFAPALSASLLALARREGVTSFMLLLALFEVQLFRRTGQGDLTVGTPIANRSRPETEGLVGFFLNTLVLRARLDGALSFRALLGQVREVCLGAYAHQELPFERLVAELSPERDLGRNPLFQVLFTLTRASSGTPSFEGIGTRGAHVDTGTAKLDLTLSIVEGADGISGSFEYATDLFEAATIDRMIAELMLLAEGAAADPGAEIGALPLLSARDRELVTVAWNATEADYPQGRCVHELVEEQAARSPSARALVFEGASLSYAALVDRSRRLARQIIARGVTPGARVGVAFERGIDLVVALLAVLGAGAAYVPLDPTYPRERLAFLIEDASLALILTQEPIATGLPVGSVPLLCHDGSSEFSSAEEPALERRASPGDIAYVIYTSGSTGKPKGVEVPHRAFVNLLWSVRRWPGLGADDRLLALASLSFDIAGLDLFLPLLVGATVEIGSRELAADGAAIAERIVRSGITVLQATPSTYRLLFESGWRGAPIKVLVGGEAFPRDLAAELCRTCASVFNMYGPTETTIYSVGHRVEAGEGVVPIGRPLANTQAYVLDPRGAPQPIGVPGELWIGGDGVARGYLGRPELTRERFVPDPFVLKPDRRLYRTGDLCRTRSDGVIEYLGRLDQQVKLRGYRIELGEIEATLAGHPSVREAVVLAREDIPGQKQLVAYLVCGEAPAEIAALRAFVAAKLPEYMVPAFFVTLDRMPLLPSGKIDRRSLPVPALPAPPEGSRLAPRSEIEARLLSIWEAVLRRRDLGVDQSFFEIGGDSILAIQVVTRARQAGIALSPRQIFQQQTIEALAEVAGTIEGAAVDEGPVTGPAPLTPIQRWWAEQRLPAPHHYNQAVMISVPAVAAEVVEQAVGILVEHHDALRLRFQEGERGWTQAIAAPGGEIPFRAISLAGRDEGEQGEIIERIAGETQASLRLAEGPLFRAVLFEAGNAQQLLLLVAHHLVIDAVSWGIVTEDLRTCCARIAGAQAPSLPARTTSFQRWAERLVELSREAVIEAEIPYWLAETRRRVRPLPVDRREGDDLESSARTVRVTLSVEDTEALLGRVPEVYRTRTPDLLLTALGLAIAPWTGQDLLLVDMEGHGREDIDSRIDVSRTVGWFTSLFPVLIDLGGAEDRRDDGEIIKAVKEQLRAIPSQGLGYGLLRYLRDDSLVARDLAALPQPEIGFNYLGQLDGLGGHGGAGSRPAVRLGPTRDPAQRRPHLLEVIAAVVGGKLGVEIIYSEGRHERATIEALGQRIVDNLRRLIVHCLSPEAGAPTPSDFARAKVTQDVLDMLIGMDPEG
ncbi:MAG: amino acid adenylation domain-containing protein [Byssovorax sp.]